MCLFKSTTQRYRYAFYEAWRRFFSAWQKYPFNHPSDRGQYRENFDD